MNTGTRKAETASILPMHPDPSSQRKVRETKQSHKNKASSAEVEEELQLSVEELQKDMEE